MLRFCEQVSALVCISVTSSTECLPSDVPATCAIRAARFSGNAQLANSKACGIRKYLTMNTRLNKTRRHIGNIIFNSRANSRPAAISSDAATPSGLLCDVNVEIIDDNFDIAISNFEEEIKIRSHACPIAFEYISNETSFDEIRIPHRLYAHEVLRTADRFRVGFENGAYVVRLHSRAEYPFFLIKSVDENYWEKKSYSLWGRSVVGANPRIVNTKASQLLIRINGRYRDELPITIWTLSSRETHVPPRSRAVNDVTIHQVYMAANRRIVRNIAKVVRHQRGVR